MGGIVRSIFGGGDDFSKVADQMRADAERQAAQARADAQRQAAQTRDSMARQQQQYEQSLAQQAAVEQARRAEQEAQKKQGTVETGPADAPTETEDDVRRRRDPRSLYMAPTGAYTGLQI